MPDQLLSDETRKDRAIELAVAGNIIEARHTVGGIVDRKCLGDAWKAILSIQGDRGDVQGVKDTIISCSDRSLLYGHTYLELPLRFARAGNVTGAIEIANAMGSWGRLSLTIIPCALMHRGDVVGAREAVSHIEDEDMRNDMVRRLDELQQKAQIQDNPM
jgi:hypothetical protein